MAHRVYANRGIPKFSTIKLRSHSGNTQSPDGGSITKPCTPWQGRSTSPTNSTISILSRRLNSTASNLPPPADSQTSNAVSESFPSASFENGFNIAESSVATIPERIGYLKELGLDYGWGPTACVEWLLEHIHIYAGTPWWASILITAVTIRLALLKPYLNAADVTARLAHVKPMMKPITDRMSEASRNQDNLTVQQCRLELSRINKRAGIQTWKAFIPMVQIFIGFGSFRLLRGMSYLPVPGLDTGGFLWLHDLTVADPLFITPLATGFAFWSVMKVCWSAFPIHET